MSLSAVLDTNVIVSAIGWRGESRSVFRLLARRAFISIRSPYLTAEWGETLSRLSTEPDWPNANWHGWLEWLKAKSRLVGDPPAKLIVRRDLKDNPVLALAIAQRAAFLVTQDRDFLDLETPYGVQCLTPREFIRQLLAAP